MWELVGLVVLIVIVVAMAQISINNSDDGLPHWPGEYKDKHK